MTTWNQLHSFIKSKYTIAYENEGSLGLDFPTSDGRTQRVAVDLEVMGDQREWICITSAFGEVSQVDPAKALDVIGARIFGAIGRVGDFYVVKHSAPLADMSAEELEYPMILTLAIADEIESKLGLGDRF